MGIKNGMRPVHPGVMRLARYFGGDARSWLNLQSIYDLRVAERANAGKVEREVRRPLDA